MRRFRCHKVVEAAKILALHPQHLALEASPDSGQPFDYAEVSTAWIDRHKPEVGGYFVRYDDGYCSFSPAKAFEDGYTLVEGA